MNTDDTARPPDRAAGHTRPTEIRAPGAPVAGDGDASATPPGTLDSIVRAQRHAEEVRSAGFFWACTVFVLDQFSKWTMLHVVELQSGPPREITSFLELYLVWNKGISYGLLQQDDPRGRWLIVAFTLIASCLVLHWLSQARSRLLAVSLGLILGGAVGNLVDRVAYGAVVDFVHFHLGEFSWYVFNVADAAIVFGVAGLVFDSIRGVFRDRASRKSVKGSGVDSASAELRTDAAERVENT